MRISNRVLDAINTVLSWNLDDDACPDAVTAQACLLAGIDPEDMWGYDLDATFH